MKNGQKHGKGIMNFPEGHKYEGDWENGLMSGKGKFFHKEVSYTNLRIL